MQIISAKEEDMSVYGKVARGRVFSVHVKINDVPALAKELIAIISDTSWIDKLEVVERVSFTARAERTIRKLVDKVFSKVEDPLSSEFGEYLISSTAQRALVDKHSHQHVPLAELLKEKVSGNPGFDFHTESESQLIAFGEAKYSGTDNPHRAALEQISSFIELHKDKAELIILKPFVTNYAVNNFVAEKRAFVAAFSINSDSPETIIGNALGSPAIDDLLEHPEVYVIGIEVGD